jgi:hypothetical protein
MSDPQPCTPAWQQRVSFYHDGGLRGEAREQVEAHLRECTACQTLLASYDRIYRDLRAMPGFEGLLTVTKPGTRRGLGAAMRPTITNPGQSLTRFSRSPGRLGGGLLAILLIMAMALLLAARNDIVLIGPSGQPQSNASTAHTSTSLTTLPALRPDGAPCANVDASNIPPYIYTDSNGIIWQVVNCLNPTEMAGLPVSDFDVGPWSPDQSRMLAISPSLADRTTGKPTTLYAVTHTGIVSQIPLSLGTTSYSADEAVWTGANTLYVRSGAKVLQVNVASSVVTPMPITATHIVWRAGMLFYSVVQANATLELHRYNPLTAQDTALANLGAVEPGCVDLHCWGAPSWDVSADGLSAAYAFPSPSAPITGGVTVPAKIMLDTLQTGATKVLAGVSLVASRAELAFSPNGTRVAFATMVAATNVEQLVIASTDGTPALSSAQQGRLAWRSDSKLLIVMPLLPSASSNAIGMTVPGWHVVTLPAATTGYAWEA